MEPGRCFWWSFSDSNPFGKGANPYKNSLGKLSGSVEAPELHSGLDRWTEGWGLLHAPARGFGSCRSGCCRVAGVEAFDLLSNNV